MLCQPPSFQPVSPKGKESILTHTSFSPKQTNHCATCSKPLCCLNIIQYPLVSSLPASGCEFTLKALVTVSEKCDQQA